MMQIKSSDGYLIDADFQSEVFEERQRRGITTPLKVRWDRRTINLWKHGTRMLEAEEATDQSLYQSFVYTGIIISCYFRAPEANTFYEFLAQTIENPYKLIELFGRDRRGFHAMAKILKPWQLFTLEDKTIIPPGLVFKMFQITDPQGNSEAWWLEEMERRHNEVIAAIPIWESDGEFSSDSFDSSIPDEDILGLSGSIESLGIHSIHSSGDED